MGVSTETTKTETAASVNGSSSAPATYSEAAAKARTVDLDEFETIVATDNNPYVYPMPKAHRRIAMFLHMFYTKTYSWPTWTYCNRNGYTELSPGCDGVTIYHFRTAGTVRLEKQWNPPCPND